MIRPVHQGSGLGERLYDARIIKAPHLICQYYKSAKKNTKQRAQYKNESFINLFFFFNATSICKGVVYIKLGARCFFQCTSPPTQMGNALGMVLCSHGHLSSGKIVSKMELEMWGILSYSLGGAQCPVCKLAFLIISIFVLARSSPALSPNSREMLRCMVFNSSALSC